MANPQKEHGFTSIANELLDAIIQADLSRYQTKVFLCIIRKTYGYGKKTDKISHSQFNKCTNIDHRSICRILTELSNRHMVIISRDNYVTEYGIQKDYTKWITSDKITSDNITTTPVIIQPVIIQPLPSDKITSDNITTTPVIIQPLPSDNPTTETSDNPTTNNRKKENITIETYTKEKTVAKTPLSVKDLFFSFKENIRYKDLDFDNEYAKFIEYWEDKKLKKPKLAAHNWLDKAVEFSKRSYSYTPNPQPGNGGSGDVISLGDGKKQVFILNGVEYPQGNPLASNDSVNDAKITSVKDIFDSYKSNARYTGIDIDNECENFKLHKNGKPLDNPELSVKLWLDNAVTRRDANKPKDRPGW